MTLFFRVTTVAAVALIFVGIAVLLVDGVASRATAGVTAAATMAVTIGYVLLLLLATRQLVLGTGRIRLLSALFVVGSLGLGVFVFAGIAFIVGQPNTTGGLG